MHTDAYKPVMAAAGWPLRRETFHLSLRKGGPFYQPLDLEAEVRALLPRGEWDEELAARLGLGAAYREALAGEVEIEALPAGTWFTDREPVLTVTGPSALVSHIEARVIALRFPIQVATLALRKPEELHARLGVLTCEAERELVLRVLDGVGVKAPEILVESDAYFAAVKERAEELLAIAGDPGRVLEAGLRAAPVLESHLIAVDAVREAGFLATTNIAAARRFGLIAGGTTGHEHTQRYFGDHAAFRAARDRVAGEVTFLLDTYSTLGSGLPAAIEVMGEEPDRAAAIRFDSEATMESDYRAGVAALREAGLEPAIHLGGGFDAATTRRFEALREELGWPRDKQRYLYGQSLVAPHAPIPTRGEVGAVYKLSASGGRPTWKTSDVPAKGSVPGRPVLWRRVAGEGSPGRIGQAGEPLPDEFVLPYPGLDVDPNTLIAMPPDLSPETQRMMENA